MKIEKGQESLPAFFCQLNREKETVSMQDFPISLVYTRKN